MVDLSIVMCYQRVYGHHDGDDLIFGCWDISHVVYLGKFDHDLTATEPWFIMVYFREIIPFYGRRTQVREISYIIYPE